MPVSLVAYETITNIYGAAFAKTWFRPVSATRRT